MDDMQEWAIQRFDGLGLMGTPNKHLKMAQLQSLLESESQEHCSIHATLNSLVLRAPNGFRLQPSAVDMTVDGGLIGDRWSTGKANPGDQVSMMNLDVAHLIANGQSVVLFGDNMFTRLDLSKAALPVGTVLEVGSARLKVSEKPHVPCGQFKARFGDAAFRWAANDHRIRGVYLTVVESGSAALGDPITILS